MPPDPVIAFRDSLRQDHAPADIGTHALALWYAGKGNWTKAHETIQDLPDRKASHIHAFLHRQEGDAGNAAYWYQKAGVPVPTVDLDREWLGLVAQVLREEI